MTIEGAISYYEGQAVYAKDHGYPLAGDWNGQIAAWLRELQERRKEPEIITCRKCKHYKPMSSDWGNCYVHGSPTELHRTCHSCDYCSWAERRTDAND